MLKKLGSLLLATTMIAGMGCNLTANAAANDESGHIPNVSTLTLKTGNNVSRFYNAKGEEVDLSDLNSSSFLRKRVMVPSKYDLRDEGRSTSVKNQGTEGFCWSFASNASMESNIITKNLNNATNDEVDLSESGGAWFSCNSTTDKSDPTYGDHRHDTANGSAGGNALHAADSLSSGYGTYPEELAMYDDRDGYSEGLRYYSDYRLKDFTFLPEDFNLIKQRIMEKGAVYYTYKCFDENYFETEDGTMTYSDNGLSIHGEDTGGGHAVTIIGWDDNFSKDNFHPDAGVSNDGAWLCKNSWGEKWGNDGFFWISYESFVYEFGQFEMQDKDTFDTIHQHQASSEQYMFGGNDVENPQYFSSANVFTAETTEELKQICYSNAIDSNVNAKIYKLNEGYTSPVDGELLAEFNSDVKYAGTHCLDVPGNITFNEGDIFSVVIEGEALITNFRYENPESPTGDKAGKSYFTENGTDWTDVADFSDASYAAIKAYTTKSTVDKTEFENIVKSIKEYKPSNAVEQFLYDNDYKEVLSLAEEAEKLMAYDNITNTEIKNACCVLEAKFDGLKMENFVINNMDDFKTLCNGLHSRTLKNRYVEFNTDLDLTGFSIEDLDYSNEYKTFDEVMAYLFGTASNVYFDGKGHTIKNFDGVNLFYRLSNATIKNLNIENFNANGVEPESGLLTGYAVNTKFVNVNVKNSEIDAGYSTALIAGSANSCTFTDCSVENCEITGGKNVGLFFVNEDENSQSELINCTAENYKIHSYYSADDNMGFSCSSPAELGREIVYIKVTDDDCVVEQLLVKLESVKVNGNEITPVGSEYHIDKSNGAVILDIEYSLYEAYEYSVYPDLENRTAEVCGYLGTDKDVVIPEKVYDFDVVGLWGEFCPDKEYAENINSVTVPGVIKSVPDIYFASLSALTKLTLKEGVKEIGKSVCENCEQLTEINLPDSIITIDEKAFYNCGAKSVTLGKNINFIGEHAFGYCETESGTTPMDGFTIYGYAGTAAETYAKANGFDFVDLSV